MPAIDPYAGRKELTGPPGHMLAITPHNTNELEFISTCFWVGTGGDLTGVDASGLTVTLKNVTAGMWHPGRFKIIKSTGTVALDIVIGSGAGW